MSHSHAPTAAPLRMGVLIPNGKLAMWLFLGTEIMFFTAFIGTYIVLRFGAPRWPLPHWQSTVIAPTCSGNPETSQLTRVTMLD